MKHCKQHQSYRQERVVNTHCDAENDVMFCIGPLADQLSQFVCQALVGTTLHQKKRMRRTSWTPTSQKAVWTEDIEGGWAEQAKPITDRMLVVTRNTKSDVSLHF